MEVPKASFAGVTALLILVPGEAPAFLKAKGPLYFMGPIWRIDPY